MMTIKQILPLIVFITELCFAQESGKYPDRIVLNLTAEPQTSIAVTWRTHQAVQLPLTQYTEETDSLNFERLAVSIPAVSEKVVLDGAYAVFHHSAVMKNLKPSTRYVYRVGGDSVWSEWNTFTTAKEGQAPLTFVYLGDPQYGFRDYLPRLFRRALMTAPEAAFWLYIGDLTTAPKKDEQWNDLFFSWDFAPRIMPSVMIPGNHEYSAVSKATMHVRDLTPLWRAHFTLPENGPETLNETAYYFDYQGVRFVMLNGNERLTQQAAWMDSLLAANPNKWTIAAVHQPVFSMGGKRDEDNIRDTLMPVFDKYSVDLVLTGHDHVYSRSHKLKNGQVVGATDKGTVYVVSVCGTKQYKMNLQYKNLLAKYAANVTLFQVITVNGNQLKYTSYTASGKVFDEFELVK